MSNNAKLTSFDLLVLFTLSYSSLFDFALTTKEILERLPVTDDFDFLLAKKEKDEGKKITKNLVKIKRSLKKIISLGLIEENDGFYFLKKKDLKNRLKREKVVNAKLAEADSFVVLAKKLPFIKAIYLTGSAAVNNADKDDDLDFLIICQRNTLWLSRFILIFLTKLKGKRPQLDADRKTVEDTRDAWCLNLWLDEAALEIPKERRSLYEAYELMQMKALYQRADFKVNILAHNKWLKKYLSLKVPRRKGISNDHNLLTSLLNTTSFILQRNYRSLFYNDSGFLISIHQAYLNDAAFKNKLLKKLDNKFIY